MKANIKKSNSFFTFLENIESSSKGHQRFICWLVQFLKPTTIVDLGFDRGLSTIAFAYRNKGHVYGIEWFEEGNYATKCFALDSAFRNISQAIRLRYVKNIHLIVGPFQDIAKKWVRKIDILHIDGAHRYESAKKHYQNWRPFMKEEGVILLHNVSSYPDEMGRFFHELPMHRFIFPHAQGLGIASRNEKVIQEIKKTFALTS